MFTPDATISDAVDISIASLSFHLEPTGGQPRANAFILVADIQGEGVEVLAARLDFHGERLGGKTVHEVGMIGSGVVLETDGSTTTAVVANSIPDLPETRAILSRARGFDTPASALSCLELLVTFVESIPDLRNRLFRTEEQTRICFEFVPDLGANGWRVDPSVTVSRLTIRES